MKGMRLCFVTKSFQGDSATGPLLLQSFAVAEIWPLIVGHFKMKTDQFAIAFSRILTISIHTQSVS